MRLRTKVTMIILIVWGLMAAGVYVGARAVLLNTYLELEDKQTIDKMNQINSTIEHLVTEVQTFDIDTAVWNDTYDFIEDKNSESVDSYIQANLSIPVFSASNVDIVLYYNKAGKYVFGRAVNASRTAEQPLPKGIESYLKPGSKLIYQPDLKTKTAGMIMIPSGIYLVAAHPILRTDYTGPSRGSLIFGRFFSSNSLKNVADITHSDLSLTRVDEIGDNTALQIAFDALSKSSTPYVQVANSQDIYGYILLRDINNAPIALVQATMPRLIYQAGVSAITSLNLIFFGFGLIFIILLLFLLRLFIINRLERLNKSIIKISKEKSFSVRVSQEGSDELTSVEKETNNMLGIINQYDEQQKVLLNQVSDELDKANQFSKEIQEAEILLKDITDTMPSMLLIINNDFKITHMNSLAEKFMGYTPDDSGKTIFEIFPSIKPYEDKFRQSARNHISNTIDKIMYVDKNKPYYFSIIIYPLSEEEQGLAVRVDDISKTVKLNESMQKNDRFASIGILTAGIAHEINNPVNFIKSATNSIKRNTNDLMKILKSYLNLDLSQNLDAQLAEINKEKESLTIDYTIEETNKLLRGVAEGAERTSAIVAGLTEFSQISVEEMVKFNVHEGLDSTLVLLSDKYKNRIKVVKEYGVIPEIECIPIKLNQVFMNLISNAIDAIPDKGEIFIKTQQVKDNIVISIKDTGVGISEENRNKIFEPFFTTKEVGKGQGLGLAITVGIISDHHGQIEVKSESGSGTEFIMTLPIMQEKATRGVS